MDHHGAVPFHPPNYNPFTARYQPQQLQQQQYPPHIITAHPQPDMYHPSLMMPRQGEIGSSPSSSNSFSASSHDYPPPITPPHLTHSRRNSRESGESSSSGSFPSTGSGAPGSLVHRHRRGHATAAMQPPSPIALRKVRKGIKKPEVEEPEEEDDAMMSDDDPSSRQKGRKDDAKKSRQDAEQKRRDQLKTAYDQLRGVIPGTSEKTSKVLLVNHARLHIGKLQDDRSTLKQEFEETKLELKSLQALNERLMNKLRAHKIDFDEDLRATQMEIPPDDEPERPPQSASSMTHPSEQLPVMQRIHPAGPPLHHRPGHTRAISSISASHYQLQPAHLNGVPMSAPMHPTSLPEYPTLSSSTPASPLKVNTAMIPSPGMAMQPMSAPHMHMSYSGSMGPGPSPASSNSSAAVRQTLYSPDGQIAYYSDEPSSSGPRSAMSSQMGVNVGQMSLEDQAYMQQQQGHPGSKPHSPRGGPMVAYPGQQYTDSSSYHPPEHFMNSQAYADPSVGLHPSSAMTNGFVQGMHDNSGYQMGGDLPNMPGSFPQPQDEPIPTPYGRHPFDKSNGQQFLVPGDIVYGNGTDPSMGIDYNAYTTNPDGTVTAIDSYLKKSPLHQQDGIATPPSTAAPSNHQTPQPIKAGSHNLSIASASSPHHLDGGLHIHSPMPPSSPSGPLSVGIAPSMLVGGADDISRDENTPQAIDVKPEGPWFRPDTTFVG